MQTHKPATDGASRTGTLTLVATPIGNMEDITLRALEVLRRCHLIAAEDTRRTRKLLSHFQISGKLVSCHAHNEARRTPAILEALRQGHHVALVSDAGSPGISDPGFALVRQAIREGFAVTAAPGPSAVILALSLSGLPTGRFTFYGFLPKRPKERVALLQEAAGVPHTLVFFEAPHRIEKALHWMLGSLGNRDAVLCRELTKRFEQVERGPLAELLERLATGEIATRGEFTLVIQGRTAQEEEQPRSERLRRALGHLRESGDEPLKEAARRAADRFGVSRREVYQAALAEQRTPRDRDG